jgi:hypothetical protein
MKKILKVKTGVVAFSCTLLLTACAKELPELPVYTPAVVELPKLPTLPTLLNTEADNTLALSFIAEDLVAGLMYISQLSPNLISLKTRSADSEFDELIKSAMINNGYSVDNRLDRSGSEHLAASILQRELGDGSTEVTGIMSINSVLLKRAYLVRGIEVEPRTTYSIRGINPQLVQPSDQVQVL